MEPQIVQKDGFSTIGMKSRCFMDQPNNIPQLWGELMGRMGEIEGIVEEGVSYGLMTNYDEASGGWDYIAAFSVEAAAPIPAGMEKTDIPAATYAVFTCTMPTIQETYDMIYQQWLPQSGYAHAPSPEFELYGPTFDANNPAAQFEIYIPIQK